MQTVTTQRLEAQPGSAHAANGLQGHTHGHGHGSHSDHTVHGHHSHHGDHSDHSVIVTRREASPILASVWVRLGTAVALLALLWVAVVWALFGHV